MIEKILKEINRLKKELNGYSASEALDYIESYINTLSEEHNEDLIEEIDKIWKTCNPIDEGMGVEMANIHIEQFDDIARHFAEWGRNHFEDKSEMVNEGLEEEIKLVALDYEQVNVEWNNDFDFIARHFAEWQKQKDMQDLLEKAEKFFNKELYVSVSDQICSMNEFKTKKDFVNYFKNYIENE